MLLKKLALSLAALLLGLLAAELLVRAVGAAPEVAPVRKGRFQLSPNPRLGYEPAPLTYHGSDLAFYDYEGASNRLGYRDVDHAVVKPEGTYRIVVLGDSIGAGFGVENLEDTFPRQLQARLRAAGVPAEVLNFSVSGYNTRQEVETLKTKALAFHPDLVLLAYCLNDRERNDGDILATLQAEQQGHGGAALAPAEPSPLLHSALFRFLRFRAFPARPAVPGPAAPELLGGDTVAESFAELAGLSREHGFKVLVAVFPKLQGERQPGQHAYVQGLSEQKGFQHLDLRAAFRQCRAKNRGEIAVDSYHPTAVGHRCAAEAMSEAVLAEH
jgi:lysophospholipase L1-like esterase